MKKRYNLYYCMMILIVTICVLTGCNSQTIDTNIYKSNTDKSYENSSYLENILKETDVQYEDNYPIYSFESRYEYLSKKYPGKTILVFASMNGGRYEKELNAILDKEKKDYAICFKDVTEGVELLDEDRGFISSYIKELLKAIKNKEQIDIIDSGGVFSGVDGFYNSYYQCVDNGWLEPWDNYLNGNSSGKKLKDLMPPNYWESMKLDGKVYGFDGSLSCLKNESGFMYNAKLYNQYPGLLTQDYSKMLKSTIDFSKANGYKCNFPNLCNPFSYSDFDFVTDCLYIDEKGKLYNFYESEYAKEIFNRIADGYKSQTVFNCFESQNEDDNKYYCVGTESLCGHFANNNFKTNNVFGMTSVNGVGIEGYTVYPKSNEKIYSTTTAVGVYTGSKNKEKAFDAITEIMTNKQLNNLLCFGTDVKVTDGLIQTSGYYNTLTVENRLIRYPYYGVNKKGSNERLKQALEEFELADNTGINIDFTKVSEQVNKVSKILMHIDEEFPSDKYKTGNEYLEELNSRIYEAGLEEIINEIVRQLGENK